MRLRAQSKSSAEHNWTAIRRGFAAWKGFGFARDVSKIGRAAAHRAALEFGHFWGGNGAVVPKGLPIIARQFTAGNT